MDIDKLQIEVETQSQGAVKGLKELKKALSSLKQLGKSPELSDLATKLEKISKIRFDNLKQLNALGDTMKQVKRLTGEVKELSGKMAKLQENMGASADTGGMKRAIADAKQVADTLSGTPTTATVNVDTPGMDAAQQKASRFRRALDSIRSATGKVSTGLKSVSARLKNASTAFSHTTKKASELSKILKIVVVYGGAFRAFMLLTQGVSEGLQNVAQYNTETAAAMSKLSTMSLYLKNSIGAALYPVIVAITPALQMMTNAIVKAFEAMGQLVSLLSGKSTYLKAKEYMKSYVDTAKSSANQIKKSFAGMDEITVIGEKDSGASGGGGGEDYSSMFEEKPIDNPKLEALLPFFQGLGTVLSSCFNTIKELANDYLYPWLVDLGNWCAENPDTLNAIGKGLAYVGIGIAGLKGASTILAPVSDFFKSVGGLKNGGTIIGAVAGALVQLYGAADALENGMNWKNLGEQLAGIGAVMLFLSLRLGPVAGAVSSIVGGIILTITSVKDWLENGVSWENFTGVMIGLAAVFGGISVLVGSWIPMAIGAVVATIAAIIMWWDEISAFFVNLWTNILGFFLNIKTTVDGFFSSIATAVVEFFGGIANWVNEHILQPIIQFFTPFVEAICVVFEAIWSVVSTVFSGIWWVISTVFTAVYEVVAHVIGIIIELVVGIGTAVWAVVSKIYEIIATIAQMIWAVVSWLFGIIWDFISGIASAIWDFISGLATTIWNFVANLATTIWDKGIKPMIDYVAAGINWVVDKFKAIVRVIKENVIDPIVKFFKDMIEKVISFFKGMIEKIVGFFKNVAISVADTVSGVFKSVLNGVFTLVENVINFFIKGLNGAIGIINKIPGVDIKKVELLSIPRFATGGFPEDGLFMANHGELVGKFSNGKTAVANNDQIVEGIAGGVYAANHEQNELLREQNKLLRQLVDKKSNGQIDVTTITTAMNRKNRRDGKTIVPVGI